MTGAGVGSARAAASVRHGGSGWDTVTAPTADQGRLRAACECDRRCVGPVADVELISQPRADVEERSGRYLPNTLRFKSHRLEVDDSCSGSERPMIKSRRCPVSYLHSLTSRESMDRGLSLPYFQRARIQRGRSK